MPHEPTPPLPALHQAELDAAGIDELLSDIAALGEVLEVQWKQGPQQHADAVPPDLAHARAALASGKARGVQIRYAFDGRVWVDTLIATPSGAKLVRMVAPAG